MVGFFFGWFFFGINREGEPETRIQEVPGFILPGTVLAAWWGKKITPISEQWDFSLGP